jgi:Domain of unknown function (DUF4157)
MSRERWFRGGDDAAAFDWQRSARELGVPADIAHAMYLRAMRLMVDIERAETLYRRWLRDAAQARRQATSPPAPGRRTQVMRHAEPVVRSWTPSQLERLGPGKWTRALTESRDEDEHVPDRNEVAALLEQLQTGAAAGRGVGDALAAADPTNAAVALRELRTQGAPLLQRVTQLAGGAVERVFGRGSAAQPLSADLAARLSPHVGPQATRAARVHTDAAAELVTEAHHARALTLGLDIYFARGEYAPGTERGDELLAHELTHVAQGQRGELTRAAAKGLESGTTLDPSEAEADLRARFAVIQLHAPEGAAPALASPSGQPSSDGERAARIAAQQRRLALAGQPSAPIAVAGAPSAARPGAPVAHPLPAMKPPASGGATGNAYVDTLSAPPSKQALELWDKAGPAASKQATAEQAKFDSSLQPMPAVLDGNTAPGAKGGGASHVPANAKKATGATPPAATAAPTPAAPPVTAGSTAAAALKPGTDKAQLEADGQKVIDSLPTTSPEVKTDPGPAPVTDLAGQGDPVRTVADQQHAISDGAKALDAEKTKIIGGKGAAQVQPAKLDQKLAVPKLAAGGELPALPVVDGMAKFKKWNLPTDAQGAFDAVSKPKMDGHLTEAKSKMSQAEAKRDTERNKAVNDAQAKVQKANADADKQQQSKVAETRAQITNKQADTLVKQENEVKKLDQQSGEKKKATIGKIDSRVQADQAKVEGDYKNATKQAEDKKKAGEADAENKKKEAQDKANKDKSWWDKAVDTVCDDIKAIGDAIDHALEEIGHAIGQLLDAVKDAACKVIDAARDFVCAALTEFGDWLKSAVTALIGSVFPGLAAELNALIDSAVNLAKQAVNAIADGLKAAVTALCDGLKGAIEAAIAVFRAAVQAAVTFAQAAITGDWSLVGKMILEGVLKLLGIDPAAFYALIGSAEDSIEKIIANPGAFVGHLVDAVKLGFQQFGQNFWAHLKDGMVQWLFGTFAAAGITMPASFDVAGVFDLACQVMGLTWPRLRGKVVKVIGEKNTERLEFVSGYIEALITGGFSGLWEKVQQDMSGLWDTVIGGVKSWLIEKVVQQAIIKIATMWNPAGAIIQLIQTAWNVYQWVKENAQRIFGLVQAVVDSVGNIVAGNIGGAANYIEASLAKLVPIAISLFANLLGLGGIADKIRGIIEKVQTKVDQAIDKLIAKVMGMFKGKDRQADADGGHPDGEPPVPKSLAEPAPAKLEKLDGALRAELRQAKSGQIIYQKNSSDPKAVTKELLAAHPDARLDKATGQLTLPPINKASVAGATSLEQLGQTVAEETGVSKVTLIKSGTSFSLHLHINPEVVGVTGPGDANDHDSLLNMSSELRSRTYALKERASGLPTSNHNRISLLNSVNELYGQVEALVELVESSGSDDSLQSELAELQKRWTALDAEVHALGPKTTVWSDRLAKATWSSHSGKHTKAKDEADAERLTTWTGSGGAPAGQYLPGIDVQALEREALRGGTVIRGDIDDPTDTIHLRYDAGRPIGYASPLKPGKGLKVSTMRVEMTSPAVFHGHPRIF